MPVSSVVRRVLATAALLAFAAPSFSASLVHVGDRASTPLTTFGIDVAVRKGLRSVIPEGWQIFVHRSLTLPATFSWSAGQPWDTALEAFASAHGFTVKIDWAERSVFFRPSDVARAEGTTGQVVSSAAAVPAAPASGIEPRPVQRPQPAPPAAFNKATLADVLTRTAAAHGYTVSFEASDISFAGAVTVLGADLVEDLQLVQRALGGERTPVSFQVFRSNRVVRVFDRVEGAALLAVVDDSAPAPVVPARPQPRAVAAAVVPATAPEPPAAPVTVLQPPPQPAVPVVETVAAAAPPLARRAPAAVSFVAPEGEPLSTSMRQFFEAQGWKLSWKADDVDFIPEYPVSLQGESMPDVLRKLKLPRFGLAVDLWTQDRVAVVRAFDPAQDR